MEPANEYIDQYLKENVLHSETIHRMKHVIHEFSLRAPKVLVTKCIDGRVHGSKLKGYPVTTIRFGRTDGNIVSTNINNFWFWNRIDRVVNDALCNTPGMPALFIAYMHRSDIPGLGCAAHGGNEKAARTAIAEQAQAVRNIFPKDQLYVIEGITNTDLMSETLIFDDGTIIDSQEIVANFGFNEPSEIFHSVFLKDQIKDPAISRNVGFKIPEELFSGKVPDFYADFQISLSLKSFLIREISGVVSSGELNSQKLIQPDLFHAVYQKLSGIRDLPSTLLPSLLYQIIWNVAYTLNQKRKLSKLPAEERSKHLDHAEELICYGEGFDLLQRNKAVLVKTGRGDDTDALLVAKKVLEKNRQNDPKPYPTIVHLNVEISGELRSWEDFNENVSSKVNTMVRNLEVVFQDQEVVILTTYSYLDQKRFYPIHTKSDPRISYPTDVILEINGEDKFSGIGLKTKEAFYAGEIIASA